MSRSVNTKARGRKHVSPPFLFFFPRSYCAITAREHVGGETVLDQTHFRHADGSRKRIPTLATRYASTKKKALTTGGLPRPIFLRIPCRYSTRKSCGRGLRACACSQALVCLHPSAAHRLRTTQNTCRWKRNKRFGREPTPRSRSGYPGEGGRCDDRGKRFFSPRESISLGRHFSFR